MRYQLNESYSIAPFTEKLLSERYFRWFHDEDVCRHNSHGIFPLTAQQVASFMAKSDTREHLVWAVIHTADGHIGNVSLQRIDLLNRNAEVAIVIGEKKHWGSGVGKLAVRAAIGHGFRALNLHKIYLGTSMDNVAMISIAKFLGMGLEGRRLAHQLRNGKWQDLLDFAIFADDFEI